MHMIDFNISESNSTSSNKTKLPRGAKTIRIPCNEILYQELSSNTNKFREYLNLQQKKHPELFP